MIFQLAGKFSFFILHYYVRSVGFHFSVSLDWHVQTLILSCSDKSFSLCFRSDGDSHLFVSISITLLSCNLFVHYPFIGFSFQMFYSCSIAGSLVFLLKPLMWLIAVSFNIIAVLGIACSFSNFVALQRNNLVIVRENAKKLTPCFIYVYIKAYGYGFISSFNVSSPFPPDFLGK